MMAVTFDSRIPHATYKETSQRLRALLKDFTEDEITHRLIESIDSGAVSPAVFGPWLGISRLPITIKHALHQKISTEVRKRAIKQLGKDLKSFRWREVWDGVGGVPGLLGTMSDLSVREVKAICHAIGGCAKAVDVDEKRRRITDLFKALQPRHFPDAPHDTQDQRSLSHHYHCLLPACTKTVVESIIDNGSKSISKSVRKRLLQTHAPILQPRAIQHVFEEGGCGKDWLSPLLASYPSKTASERGFSASMETSLSVLKRLANKERTLMSDQWVALELVEPLLRRAVKKRASWATIQEIVDLTVSYVEEHPAVAREIEHRIGGTFGDGYKWYRTGGILHLVAVCWSHRPDLFERQLRFFLSCSHPDASKVEIDELGYLLDGVARSRRYPLLKLCVNAITGKNLDLEEDLKDIKGTLPCGMLDGMRPDEALGLFTRLHLAKGDDILGTGPFYDTILDYGPTPSSPNGDPGMCRIVLLQKSGCQEDAERVAQNCIQDSKKAATSQSSSEKRAFYAKATLNYAVASGSLGLYKEALQWARRFVRDPLVVQKLHQQHQGNVKTLLSGIPNRISLGAGPLDLRKRVEIANEIIADLYDTACAALREPSFAVHNWHGTLCLPSHAIEQRRRRALELKKVLGVSDDEIFEMLWKNTLTMLLALEERALAPDHERLMADSARGVLDYGHVSRIPLKDEEPSTYRFFDELAKARDELWRKFRLTAHPAAATLPAPFPRGLPIQHLIRPYVLEVHDLRSFTPYIAFRVHAAVFPNPEGALTPFPTDEETQAAIGAFIDAYAFALKIYIPKSLNEEERKRRVNLAWNHATGPLSQGRMSPKEAERYWQKAEIMERVFTDIWPHKQSSESTSEDWPLLPNVDSPIVAEEWDPMPPKRDGERARKIEPVTYIDYSKNMRRQTKDPDVHSALEIVTPSIPGVDVDGIWSAEKIKRAKGRPAMREGQILSALLFLDTFNSSKTRILSNPFPWKEVVRYPAVYLDGQFLSGKLDIDTAFSVMEAHIASIPPVLLAQVAEHTIATLSTTDRMTRGQADVERLAFKLVQILARSDRPSLASELAIRSIMDRPDASSWHRRLMFPGFFKILPASDAQACMATFADAILAKVEEQSKAKEVTEEQTSTPADLAEPTKVDERVPRQPLVKVTTVKFLAQLLSDTEFVSTEFALAILTKLMAKASHVDIRRAIVNSLLNMLRSAPPELAKEVLLALENIIPLAGNIRERTPVTNSDWTHAKETVSPPDLDPDFNLAESAPILSSLLSFLESTQENFAHRGAYIDRIILPVINGLKKQTAQWVSIFLRRQGLDEAAQKEFNIPPLPLDKAVLSELLQRGSSHVPLSLLEECVTYLSFNIAPSAPVKAFNKKLEEDVSLKDQRDTKIWLSRFGEGPDIGMYGRVFNLAYLLEEPSQLQNHITLKDVQAQFLKLYTTLLWHDKPQFTCLSYLTRPLWPFSKGAEVDEDWAEYYKPIVEAMILYTEGLRTRDWQRDANRHPKVLPDTFKYRMWLLQYAAQHSSEAHAGNHEAHCKAFADRVSKTIEQITGTLYHSKFSLLKDAMGYVKDDDRLRVACYLGDISKTKLSWLTMQDHLRIELAVELLPADEEPSNDKDLERRVHMLKESWKQSESEEVRRFAFSLEKTE